MNYVELKRKHEQDVNAFPMKFAFSKAQLARGMEELGLKATDTDKITWIGAGGFILDTDKARYLEMMGRIDREMKEAIEADTTGEGFIFRMFDYELSNHEYIISGDVRDTLDALGITYEEIEASQPLKHGLQKALEAQWRNAQ